MSAPVLIALAGVAGAIVSGIVALLVAKRQHSGKIETTEAKDLWTALRAYADDLKLRAATLQEENTLLYREIAAMREEMTVVKARCAAQEVSLELMRRELIELRQQLPVPEPPAT